MKTFDYDIVTTKLHPPLPGGYCYAAKVAHIYEYLDGRGREIYPNIGEYWGITAAEAAAKVREKVEEWIKAQQAK